MLKSYNIANLRNYIISHIRDTFELEIYREVDKLVVDIYITFASSRIGHTVTIMDYELENISGPTMDAKIMNLILKKLGIIE